MIKEILVARDAEIEGIPFFSAAYEAYKRNISRDSESVSDSGRSERFGCGYGGGGSYSGSGYGDGDGGGDGGGSGLGSESLGLLEKRGGGYSNGYGHGDGGGYGGGCGCVNA